VRVPEPLPFLPGADALVIAADAGLRTLQRAGRLPDLTVGDFDSLGAVPEGCGTVLRYPVQKDDTDAALAAEAALARGCDTFLFCGCLGGALDHTLANLCLLASLAERGCTAYLLGGGHRCYRTVRTRRDLLPRLRAGQTLRVLSQRPFRRRKPFPVCDIPCRMPFLYRQRALGVSNAFTGSEASVRVTSGTLLLYAAQYNFPFLLDLSAHRR
jgi:thiamine pyrophosphokinase